MIDRDQVEAALALFETAPLYDMGWQVDPADLEPLAEAARLLLDFPTDEMVRAGVVALRGEGRARHVDSADWEEVRAVLEAVRRSMIGDNHG